MGDYLWTNKDVPKTHPLYPSLVTATRAPLLSGADDNFPLIEQENESTQTAPRL